MAPIFAERNQGCWPDPLRPSPGQVPCSQDQGQVRSRLWGEGPGRWGNCVLGQHAPQEGKGCREVQSLWTVCFRRSHPEGSDLRDGVESWGVALYQDGEGPSDTWGDPGVGSFMY